MKLHIVDHPLIAHKLTMMRDKNCNSKNFRELCGEIASLMTYEVTRDWSLVPIEIETPLETMTGSRLEGEVTIIPILRAGLGLLNGVLRMVPHAHVGHIATAACRNSWTRNVSSSIPCWPRAVPRQQRSRC